MSRGNPLPPAAIRAMFDRVAPVYDLMNTVMTAGLDARWRRAAAGAAGLGRGDRALDVACGTGRLTEALARAVGPAGSAIGVDLAPGMIRRARRRAMRLRGGYGATPAYLEADALALPFGDGSFDAAAIGFGLRNVADYTAALREMTRVVVPGGRVVVLEIAIPPSGVARILFQTWFRRVVPLLGSVAGRGSAYGYLPQSLLAYPGPDAMADRMRSAGLEPVQWRYLPSRMATLHLGRRPGP